MAEKEYIERNAVIEEIESLSVTVTGLRAGKNLLTRYAKHYKDSVVKVLSDVPSADVAPVVHGEWIPSPDGIHQIKCSNCGADAPYRRESDFTHDIGIRPYKSNYCPNCFAKMDGERKERDNA